MKWFQSSNCTSSALQFFLMTLVNLSFPTSRKTESMKKMNNFVSTFLVSLSYFFWIMFLDWSVGWGFSPWFALLRKETCQKMVVRQIKKVDEVYVLTERLPCFSCMFQFFLLKMGCLPRVESKRFLSWHDRWLGVWSVRKKTLNLWRHLEKRKTIQQRL